MRRRLPKAKERQQFDARAAGARCSLCPLSVSCKPVAPRIVPGAKLTVVESWPARSEDERGEPTRHPASELLRKNLQAANVEDYSYSWAILCRPPKGTTKKDIDVAIECCQPRLQRDVAPEQASIDSGVSERKWILALGPEAFKATTGKLQLDPWVGAPTDAIWEGARCIPTYSPGWILKPDGSAYAPTFATHLWRAAYLCDGRLKDWEWPPDIVDEGEALTFTLASLARRAACGEEISVDIETRGKGTKAEISCIGFAADWQETNNIHACCIQLPFKNPRDEELVRQILRKGVMLGQFITNFDRPCLDHHGYDLTPHYEDTLLAASILDPQVPKGLGFLTSSEFHAPAHKAEFKTDKDTGVMQGDWDSRDPEVERRRRIYCLRDAFVTLLVRKRQKQRLAEYV